MTRFDIGIIGGGQLGMMMASEAKAMNKTTIVLDPNKDCSCKTVADKIIVGKYDDIEKLCELGNASSVLSYEFENVPSSALELLNGKYNIPQGIRPLYDSQDRLIEKDNANKGGLETVRYHKCDNATDIQDFLKETSFPIIYKTRREGYDGHGQYILRDESNIDKLIPKLEKDNGILEEMCHFDYECSLIMIRSKDQFIHFPISRNVHKDGILDLSIVDNSVPAENIVKASEEFMKKNSYCGILTIEFFVKGDQFYFNEMAPRPHNSGHYTLEGCNTNQFKELDHFLLGERLETPYLKSPTIMKNILGRDMKNLEKYMKIRNANLHMYYKKEERELRKLGHITFTDMTLDEFNEAKKELNIED